MRFCWLPSRRCCSQSHFTSVVLDSEHAAKVLAEAPSPSRLVRGSFPLPRSGRACLTLLLGAGPAADAEELLKSVLTFRSCLEGSIFVQLVRKGSQITLGLEKGRESGQ